jgi:chromosome segregation ATPase
MSDITKKKENLEERLVFLNEEISRLESIRAEKERFIKDSDEKINIIKLENDKRKNELKDDILMLENDKIVKDKELEEVNKVISDSNTALSEINDKLTKQLAQLQLVKDEISNKNDTVLDLQAKIEKYNQELLNSNNTLDLRAKELEEKESEFLNKLNALNDKLRSIEDRELALSKKQSEITNNENILKQESELLKSEKEGVDKERDVIISTEKEISAKISSISLKEQETGALLAQAKNSKNEAENTLKSVNERDAELKKRETEFLLKEKELEADKRILKIKMKQVIE